MSTRQLKPFGAKGKVSGHHDATLRFMITTLRFFLAKHLIPRATVFFSFAGMREIKARKTRSGGLRASSRPSNARGWIGQCARKTVGRKARKECRRVAARRAPACRLIEGVRVHTNSAKLRSATPREYEGQGLTANFKFAKRRFSLANLIFLQTCPHRLAVVWRAHRHPSSLSRANSVTLPARGAAGALMSR
jgi:hypothetical protein